MGLGRAGLIQSNLQAGVGYWVVSRGSKGGGCPSFQGRVLLTTSELRLGASELLPRAFPERLTWSQSSRCTERGIETRPTQRCVYMYVHTHTHTCVQYSLTGLGTLLPFLCPGLEISKIF